MSSTHGFQAPADRQGNRFTTTRWSIVVAAGGPRSPNARAALSTLCESYWYPLYAYSRRRGHTHQDAQDLIQSFLASLLESEGLRVVDPKRGKFRSFLLTALKNFSAKQWRTESTQKRGGSSVILSLDYHEAEGRYFCEPEDERTPETIFEHKWAIAILESAMKKLSDEQRSAGKQARFDLLKMHLGGDSEQVPYRELASTLGISEGAIKVAVHRLRARYGQILRDEISQTVSNPGDLDNELRAIFDAVSS